MVFSKIISPFLSHKFPDWNIQNIRSFLKKSPPFPALERGFVELCYSPARIPKQLAKSPLNISAPRRQFQLTLRTIKPKA